MKKDIVRPEIKINNLHNNEKTQWVIRERENNDPIRVYSLLDKENNSLCDIQCHIQSEIKEDETIHTRTLLSVQKNNTDSSLDFDITRRIVSLLRHQKINEIDMDKIQDSLYENGVVALMEADQDHNIDNMSLSFRSVKSILKDKELRDKFHSDPKEHEALEDQLLPPYELLTTIQPKMVHWLDISTLSDKKEVNNEPVKKNKGLEI